jgi:hypothetical protein
LAGGIFSGIRNVAHSGIALLSGDVTDAPSIASSDNVLQIRAMPNPMRSATRVEYVLAHESDVDVSVFDVAGRFIAQLSRGRMPAGTHSAAWNGEGPHGSSPAGVYFVRVRTEGQTLSERVVLLR